MAIASALRASSEKKKTPRRSAIFAYVRTFSSGKAESQGSGGVPRSRTPLIRNGTIPSQARSSKVSSSRPTGSAARIVATGIGQCAKRRSFQDCAMTHAPRGSGQGRCATSLRMPMVVRKAYG